MLKKIKEQETMVIRQSEEERPIEDPRGDILRSIYEKKPSVMDVKVRQISFLVKTTMESHRHSKKLRIL